MRWLDENLPLVAIPYFALGLAVALAPSVEGRPDDPAGPSPVDIAFLIVGHLVLAPVWLWLHRRYRRSKVRRVHQFGYLLPAASYLFPALVGLLSLIF